MFVISAMGALWDLDVSGLEPPVADSLLALWSRAAVEVPEGGGGAADVQRFVVARRDDGAVSVGDEIHRGADEHLPYAVSRALTMASIKRRVGEAVLLHAAGVSLPDGSTVALVAASGTGKTTASRLLCQTFGYVSDETVTIDLDGRVHSWAKPLSVIVDPASPWEKHEHSPDELGLVRAPEDLRFRAIILLARDPEHEGEPVLEQVGLIDALDAVLPQTSSLLTLDAPLSHLSSLLTMSGGPWALTYREVDECVDLITAVAQGTSPVEADPPEWSATSAAVAPEGTEHPELPRWERAERIGEHTVIRRGPHRESVSSEGRAMVLVPNGVILLEGLGAELWAALDVPRPVSELTAVAEESLGEHPEAGPLVLEAVRDLVRIGLAVSVGRSQGTTPGIRSVHE